MKLHIDREWLMRKIANEPEGECGAGFELDFRDGNRSVELLRMMVKPPVDPADDRDNPNIYKYEEDTDK